MLRIRKGDEVIVRSGKDKGKRGKVLRLVGNNRVVVEGINVAKKHQKPQPTINQPGGIVDKTLPIDLSNVGIFNPVTKKVDRVGFRVLDDGEKVRFFKSTNETVDV